VYTLQQKLVTAEYSGYSRMDVLHMGDAMSYGRWLSIIQMNTMPPSTMLKLERQVT